MAVGTPTPSRSAKGLFLWARRVVKLWRWFQGIPLAKWLAPIESWPHLVIGLVALEIPALVWALVVVDVGVKGLGEPGPWSVVIGPLVWTALKGLEEKIKYRGLGKLALGDLGLLGGTIAWVTMHQFMSFDASPNPWRLPGDTFSGIFYMKLWSGQWRRRWWLWALVFHSLSNVVYVLLLQTLVVAFGP